MANPLALYVNNPDTVGRAFQGFGDAQVMQEAAAKRQQAEDAARMQKLGPIANIAGSISRLPPEARAKGLEDAKATIATMYGNDPQVVQMLRNVTPDNYQYYAEALTDELTRLKQDKTGAEIGLVGAKIADVGYDNSRADALAGNTMGNNNARTGGYLANVNSMIGSREGKDAATAYGQLPDGYVMGPGGVPVQMAGADGKPIVQPKAPAGSTARDFPAAVIKAEEEDVAAIQTAKALESDTAAWLKRLDGKTPQGTPNLGLAQNLGARVMNYLGVGTPETADYAELRSFATRLVNESLRLNKGVQTEGDAQRAANELLSNINDPETVKRQMGVLLGLNQRAADQRTAAFRQRRQRYSLPEADLSGFTAPPSPYARGGAPQGSIPLPQGLDAGEGDEVQGPDGRTYVVTGGALVPK